MIVGIDPGISGGAVCLDASGAPLWACAWSEVQREGEQHFELTYEDLDSKRPLHILTRTLAGVGAYLGSYVERGTAHLVVEGLYVASMQRTEAALSLGRSQGLLTAYLLEYALSYEEIKASSWRPEVLDTTAHVDSETADLLALRQWRPMWRGVLAEHAHTAEARGIAECRRRQLWTERAQQRLPVAEPQRRGRRL